MSPTEDDPDASTLVAIPELPAEGRGIAEAVVRDEAWCSLVATRED